MRIVPLQTKKIIRNLIILALAAVGGWFLNAHFFGRPQSSAPHMENPYVLVKEASIKDISQKKKFIAEVEAINSVDIVPQVAGYLEKVLFTEGSFVKTGDVLFIIEQAKYQANLVAREADLASAEANYKQIKSNHNRMQALFADKVLPEAELEISENNLAQAEAAIKAAKANLNLAQIDMNHTKVESPIDGYVGKAFITKGNFVNSASGKLAKVVQTSPIRIVFSVTDKDREDFFKLAQAERKKIAVEMAMPDGSTVKQNIETMFADNEVNPETATIPIYMNYDNKNKILVPGNYIDVYIRLSEEQTAAIIPLTAVAQDAHGKYVMAVDNDNVAVQKYLELGEAFGANDIIVKKGLHAGERVIVQGLQKVRNGQKINPTIVPEK